jgi:3-phosphoglycerate kinase
MSSTSDPSFAQQLVQLADIYVNDAFGARSSSVLPARSRLTPTVGPVSKQQLRMGHPREAAGDAQGKVLLT